MIGKFKIKTNVRIFLVNRQTREIKKQLKKCNAIFTEYEDKKLFKIIINELVKNKAIGWFSGKMEFGPRALGGRSVIITQCLQKFKKSLI